MKKRRGLRDEERALWQRVTRSVDPLRPEERPSKTEPAPSAPTTPPAARVAADPAPPKSAETPGKAAPVKKPDARPGAIDRKLRRKLARGREEIDGRIDLHGMTQAEAHRALIGFLETSLSHRRRVVLVITGKGKGGDGSGILRRAVPEWLETRQMRRVVVGYGPAAASHGGDGALYVRLRTLGKLRRG